MIVYQAHVGVFPLTSAGKAATFLDMITNIPYLAALGANVLQLLPVDEVETEPSMGYNGADYFSPDFPYVVTDVDTLKARLLTINNLLTAKGMTPLSLDDITPRAGTQSAGRPLPCLWNRGGVRRGLQPCRRFLSEWTAGQ